jgi:hypothetical protein
MWVIGAELIAVAPLIICGVNMRSIGACFEYAVLFSLSVGPLMLSITCAMNRLWVMSLSLLVLCFLAKGLAVRFKRDFEFEFETTEHLDTIQTASDAKFHLSNSTSLLMAKASFWMLWLCALSYAICLRYLGFSLLLSAVAGFFSALAQLIIIGSFSLVFFIWLFNSRLRAKKRNS